MARIALGCPCNRPPTGAGFAWATGPARGGYRAGPCQKPFASGLGGQYLLPTWAAPGRGPGAPGPGPKSGDDLATDTTAPHRPRMTKPRAGTTRDSAAVDRTAPFSLSLTPRKSAQAKAFTAA